MMRFVQRLVYGRIVQSAMDPVDPEVGEGDEERELRIVIPLPWTIGGTVVHFGVALDFEPEDWCGEDSHDGHGPEGL